MFTTEQVAALDTVLSSPALIEAIQRRLANLAPGKPPQKQPAGGNRMYAALTRQGADQTKAARWPGPSTYDRLRGALLRGPMQRKAAAASPYEEAVQNEIAAQQQLEASHEAVAVAEDNLLTAMAFRSALKVRLLNSGQADQVHAIEERDDIWPYLDGGSAAPPVGKIARNFGFGG